MRYKISQYADALVEALDGATDETARTRTRAFVALLQKHQMLGRAERIAGMVERRLAKRAGVTRITLESAAALSPAFRTELSELFGDKVWIAEHVQPDLLAGVRIVIDDETLIDASGKRRLATLFQTH